MSVDKSRPHAIKVSDIGIPKEVMKDCEDPRDLLRELISNAGAEEVYADKVGYSNLQIQNTDFPSELEMMVVGWTIREMKVIRDV